VSRWDERRAHRDRLMKRRASYGGGVFRNDPVQLARMVDTPTPCSCWMCKSPRYVFKGRDRLPPQERREDERTRYEAAQTLIDYADTWLEWPECGHPPFEPTFHFAVSGWPGIRRLP